MGWGGWHGAHGGGTTDGHDFWVYIFAYLWETFWIYPLNHLIINKSHKLNF